MAQRKILIVTNRVPFPLKDGGNLAMLAMIDGYQQAGWQVYLLSMNTSRHYVKHEQLKQLYRELYAFEWVDVDNSLKWTNIAKNYIFSNQPEHALRFYNEGFREKLESVITSFKPDVVQVESVYLSTYMPTIKEHSDAVTILRLHNIEYQIWGGMANRNKNRIKKIYLNNLTERIRNFERAAWKEYDLLLPITEKDANLVNRFEIVKNMLVAPFSIDITKIKKGINEQWVGYHIGAMDWIPNREGMHWFIHETWSKIRRVAPEFEFYFAGRNMPQEFKKLKVPGVHCLDEVPSAEEFISDKKILIVPITSGGGIRVKILEAMAAGKVVITTKSGIKGIDAKPGEHFLVAKKPEEFARAVKWCLENKEAASAMAERGCDLVKEKYENSMVIKKVLDAVEGIMIAHVHHHLV